MVFLIFLSYIFLSSVPNDDQKLGEHLHETEHAIIDKMGKDSANHQIRARFGEMHDFNTVAWLQTRIQSPVNSVIGIVDQRRPWRLCYRNSQRCVDVLRLSPIIVNVHLM